MNDDDEGKGQQAAEDLAEQAKEDVESDGSAAGVEPDPEGGTGDPA